MFNFLSEEKQHEQLIMENKGWEFLKQSPEGFWKAPKCMQMKD